MSQSQICLTPVKTSIKTNLKKQSTAQLLLLVLTLEALFVPVRFQVVRPLVLAYYGALTDVTAE